LEALERLAARGAIEILVGQLADPSTLLLEAAGHQRAVKDHVDDRLGAAELSLVRADELRDRRLTLHESADHHRGVVGIAHLLRGFGDDRHDLVFRELHRFAGYATART